MSLSCFFENTACYAARLFCYLVVGGRRHLTLSGCFFLLHCLLFATPPLLAQQAPIQFGKVQAKDFLKQTAADTSAAIILCDLGRSRIEGGKEGWEIKFVRTTRIQILRKAGYGWATVEVPLYHDKGKAERLRDLKGYTYNLVNGQVVKEKLGTEAVFKEKADANYQYYRFTLPNVREGSIIEFTYTISSDFLFNFQGWQFQYEIPVRWSEYQTVIPVFFRYKQLTRGYLRAKYEEKVVPYSTHLTQQSQSLAPAQELAIASQSVNERWVMENVPAFQTEPYLTTARDYISSLSFELNSIQYPNQPEQNVASTWEKINADLNEHALFGDLLVNSPLMAEARVLVTQHPTDLRQRAQAVLALVQRTVRYNKENRVYAEAPLRRVVEQHQGNAAEVNLLLVQTLREAGLSANPVLLSTRAHGQILLDLPLLTQFNYVVAQVALPDQPDALLDATEPLAPLGVLPKRCLNGQGRLIAKDPTQGRWVPLTPRQKFVEYASFNLTLDQQGGLLGTARFEQSGYAGLQTREQLRESTEPTYLTSLRQDHPEWVFTKPVLQHVADLDQPVALAVALQIPGSETPISTIYLSLLGQLTNIQNPFRSEERHYPVSFGMAHEQTTNITLTLPPDFVLQEIPAPVILALPNSGGRFLFQATQLTPTSLQMTARLQLSKPEYAATEYAALRELYKQAAAKVSEVLVVRRK